MIKCDLINTYVRLYLFPSDIIKKNCDNYIQLSNSIKSNFMDVLTMQLIVASENLHDVKYLLIKNIVAFIYSKIHERKLSETIVSKLLFEANGLFMNRPFMYTPARTE